MAKQLSVRKVNPLPHVREELTHTHMHAFRCHDSFDSVGARVKLSCVVIRSFSLFRSFFSSLDLYFFILLFVISLFGSFFRYMLLYFFFFYRA